jgi:hypothetical protein
VFNNMDRKSDPKLMSDVKSEQAGPDLDTLSESQRSAYDTLVRGGMKPAKAFQTARRLP